MQSGLDKAGQAAFKDFEYTGWERSVDQYHLSFSTLTQQTIPKLIESLGLKEGDLLLDEACGPGYLSKAAASQGIRAIGIDFSDLMIAKARVFAPEIDIRKGDAEQLELPTESFDGVGMNFGLLHLGNPEKAANEAFRVLKPGKTFAFTVWATPDEALGFGVVLKAVQKFGDPQVAIPPGPPFFTYSDPIVSQKLLESAGFRDVEFTKIPLTWNLSSGKEFFEAYYLGTPRTGGLLRAQKPEVVEQIRKAVVEEIDSNYCKGNSVSIPMPAWLYTGRK